ncbi:type III glutamate--ammonia ligase [Schlesneria paludicola]|uniref:type III glutamate--ammonia ligase n=1 Tax=Schlesneria paludicola TaxID=360056 RepID=UPI000492A067|nr:type III glutamate--ammonia ligase [Schlesneria paludicola]
MSLLETAKTLGLRYFLVSYSDLMGTSRSKLIPVAAIQEVCKNGAPFAGFATWLDLTPADPDVFAKPDPESLIQLPWKPEVGWLAADLWMDGQPLAQGPRNVLKRSIARAAQHGYEMRTGVECEFFLLTPDGQSVSDPFDDQKKPCYDQQALVRRYELIAAICDALTDLGWEPYQNDHEDANGQFEINWKYGEALQTADRQTFFKFLVKSLAELHGMRATFMPKPFSRLTGNGCHIHVSLWDREKKANLFADTRDDLGLSTLAYEFLGGVLNSAEALSALVTPTVNSYRRIHARGTSSGATWSPNTISYSGNNRTHMIRIPDGGRFELRLADGSANPYLMAAGLLEAGLYGMAHHCQPGPPSKTNAYFEQLPPDMRVLPDNLLDSLRALQNDTILKAGLGEEFTRAYLKLKRAEWRDYSSHVSKWETEHTLDC